MGNNFLTNSWELKEEKSLVIILTDKCSRKKSNAVWHLLIIMQITTNQNEQVDDRNGVIEQRRAQ